MDPTNSKARPERIETDSSLRAERNKTDEQLSKTGSEVEREADQVVELARERADTLLEAERDKADATLKKAAGSAKADEVLVEARASEDEAVTEERAAADERLETEREEEKRAIKLLLTMEREATDERLLTERIRADRAVASRDDFLAIVSHDVRGILSGIALSADVLMRTPLEGATQERTKREAQRIGRLTGRMNRLIGDLLDVVSMESGKLNVVMTEQDATRLLTETMENFQLAAAAREVLMTFDMSRGRFVARFDHDRILQVLANLVGNALKFTEGGGTIALHLVSADGTIRFTVMDNGCGIPTDQIDAIFERFSQASQADRRGLGLGLYIARCIVEAHGGKLWAESTPGKGSAFHFTLPEIRA
jgi:signal transduction histidine kinase